VACGGRKKGKEKKKGKERKKEKERKEGKEGKKGKEGSGGLTVGARPRDFFSPLCPGPSAHA
jgi:hypothetical protein